MGLFLDSHTHYDDDRYNGEVDEILLDLKNNNVGTVINVGCDVETSQKAIYFAEKYPFVYAAVGYHPNYVSNMTGRDLEILKELSGHEKVRAWGEIGLDYHYDYSAQNTQKDCFLKQLDAAAGLNLPVIIHSRDATGDMMEIMRGFKGGALFHCYSGSLETAKEIIKLGFYISFSGTVTYKNAKNIKETAASVPSDRYLIETDCPYLSPEPVRGTRNDSRNLVYTATVVANLRGIPVEQAGAETTANAKRFFGI
jgi:TatD DNase family protein